MLYDGLVVLALSFALALGFILLFGDASHGLKRYALQLFLWLGIGLYFVWCWRKSGQTLAMQTWQLKLSDGQTKLLNWPQALIRYALASLSLAAFGLGFVWALFDRDGLFLHDRLLHSRITFVPRAAT
ncbi:MAG: RDD family protein [Candidatus Methylopumilus sp.]|nr:RDD family protein [Candidatus Methylopumilus sp.]